MFDSIVYNLFYNKDFIGMLLINLLMFGCIIALIGAAINKNFVKYFGGGMALSALAYGFISILIAMVTDLIKAWV